MNDERTFLRMKVTTDMQIRVECMVCQRIGPLNLIETTLLGLIQYMRKKSYESRSSMHARLDTLKYSTAPSLFNNRGSTGYRTTLQVRRVANPRNTEYSMVRSVSVLESTEHFTYARYRLAQVVNTSWCSRYPLTERPGMFPGRLTVFAA